MSRVFLCCRTSSQSSLRHATLAIEPICLLLFHSMGPSQVFHSCWLLGRPSCAKATRTIPTYCSFAPEMAPWGSAQLGPSFTVRRNVRGSSASQQGSFLMHAWINTFYTPTLSSFTVVKCTKSGSGVNRIRQTVTQSNPSRAFCSQASINSVEAWLELIITLWLSSANSYTPQCTREKVRRFSI